MSIRANCRSVVSPQTFIVAISGWPDARRLGTRSQKQDPLQMGTPQDPGAVFNMLWAGNNQLFSEIAAQFPDGAATAFTVGVGLAMLAGQCALSAYFSFVATSGPWHAMPGFTAHQLIYCERLTCPPAPTPHHTPLSAPHHTRLPPL